MTATDPETLDIEPQMQQAGEAWGHRASDWSCLWEHYSLDVLLAMFAGLGVAPGVELLDIACGSGLAVRVAAGMGAHVGGIDAAGELIAVARARTPGADLRVGSMFELPWADASFDAAISINGIWGGCEAALAEAVRVLRPQGMFAMSFWGFGPPLDLRRCFKIFAAASPEAHSSSMRRLNNISGAGCGRGDARGRRLRHRGTIESHLGGRMARSRHRVAGNGERRTHGAGAAQWRRRRTPA